MMTQRILALLSIFVASASAFTVVQSSIARPSTTALSESFGFDFAEDSYENTPEVILGEANYKQWVAYDERISCHVALVHSLVVSSVPSSRQPRLHLDSLVTLLLAHTHSLLLSHCPCNTK